MTPDEPAIALRGVSFDRDGLAVLSDVDLDVARGGFLGVVGPNGGGKTTLLKLVLGLLVPTRGDVRVLGRAPADARRDVGYVPQFASFRRDFPISVQETVLMGRLGRTRGWGPHSLRDHDAAREAMARAEVDQLARRAVGSLSGGELQRVLIARALVAEPSLLLLDEPTASVDARLEQQIFDLMRALTERCAVVLVSHDIGFVTRYVTRVACVNRRVVCHHPADIDGSVIEALYGRPMRVVPHDEGLAPRGPS